MKKIFLSTAIILALMVLFCQQSLSQVLINFNPVLNGQTLNGLLMAQISNAGGVNYDGRMKITVRDERNKVVVILQSDRFVVRPGNNFLPAGIFSQGNIRFGNSYAVATLSQTGKLPEGEFEYCYEFSTLEKPSGSNDDKIFENCFNAFIQPFTSLGLIYPSDEDSICSQRPDFTWQPLIPSNAATRYRLLVTEKKEKQSLQEAVANNLPVFNQDDIAGFNLFYPPQLSPLTMGKTYAWQVTAYSQGTMLTKSETWEFTVGCQKERVDSLKDSYRELKPSLNGDFYTAEGTLRFAIANAYQPVVMEYQIIDLSNQQIKFKKLPVIKLQTGLNKIDIDLSDISGMETGKMYQLNINNIGNQRLYLRFIYKANEFE